MSLFQLKTIKYLGKSTNPSSVEILRPLLDSSDDDLRFAAFDSLFLRKDDDIYVLLFRIVLADEERWKDAKCLTPERWARLANSAFRCENAKVRDAAAQAIVKYKIYEALPNVLLYLEGSDAAMARTARGMLVQLAESFYQDLANAPSDLERRNLDRRREWFVQQLDAPIKRFAANGIDELIQSLLIVTKKDYETIRTIIGDHRSLACKRASELLRFGDHGSYVRLLLSYVPDADSPAVIDEILTTRSDKIFVRKLVEMVGVNPSYDFRMALKRFKDFSWFDDMNPDLPDLLEGIEPCAIQLFQASGMPKEKMVRLYRFFFENPSFLARRTAAQSIRRLVGDEVNDLLLEYVIDPDAETAATIFRLLKSRNVKELDHMFLQLVERPEPEIRQAIYDTMPELHVEAFASRIGQLPTETAKVLGRFVRNVDPNTFKVVNDDIHSPIPVRRQAACGVAAATGLAPEFEHRLLELAETDDETNVRLSAIAALGCVLTKESVETLKMLMSDRSVDIQGAAAAALKDWMTAYQKSV